MYFHLVSKISRLRKKKGARFAEKNFATWLNQSFFKGVFRGQKNSEGRKGSLKDLGLFMKNNQGSCELYIPKGVPLLER